MEITYFQEDFYYSCKAFPRCKVLSKRYPKTSIDLKLLKVQVLHEKYYTVKETDFSMQVDVKENDVSSISGPESCPCVNVCILQTGKDGSLTPMDKSILKYYKLKNSTTVIFVIDGDITDLQYCAISKEINRELALRKSFNNNVLHRLFHCKADDIAIRISLLFEKQLIAGIKSSTADLDIKNVEDQNKLDLQYHQFKNVSLRNEMICEFGYENDHLFVSIEDPKHEVDVKDYLCKFLPNASDIKVIECTEIEIKHLALKSGDEVNINKVKGTVGLCLKDETRYFCATCNHVVEKGLNRTIEIDSSITDVIITNSEKETFATDQVLTPLNVMDFSAIRLVRNDIDITYGLKSQGARFVDGTVFGTDMMLPTSTAVYKWGATSNLTNGTFRGILERRNHPAKFKIESDGLKLFGEPGDSGSLICYSEGGFDFAAFILVACDENDKNMIIGHKLADALKLFDNKLIPLIKI